MQKITTFLTFNDQAEQAVEFYTSVFPDAKVTSVMRYTSAGPGPEGAVMAATFQIGGQEFFALNGGPSFQFGLGISLFVNCDTQAEVDRLWEKLAAGGGKHLECGWLQDRFGVAWQIVPTVMKRYLADPDRERTARVMKAMMTMGKLDIARLTAAYEGRPA